MMRVGILLSLVLATASCGAVRNTAGALGVGASATNRTTLEVDGVRYRARSTADREDRRKFSVTASPASPSLDGAIETAVYQANRYCILTFGGSDKDWIVGPDTPRDALDLSGGEVTLEGRCTQK